MIVSLHLLHTLYLSKEKKEFLELKLSITKKEEQKMPSRVDGDAKYCWLVEVTRRKGIRQGDFSVSPNYIRGSSMSKRRNMREKESERERSNIGRWKYMQNINTRHNKLQNVENHTTTKVNVRDTSQYNKLNAPQKKI